MSPDGRINELCNRFVLTNDPDELCELTGLLRSALHAKIKELTDGIANVIGSTSYASLLEKPDARGTPSERKPPTADYSAA